MLIDLDAPVVAADRRAPGRWRLGLVVVAALLLALGGAAPPAGATGLVEVASTEGTAVRDRALTGDALFTVEAAGPGRSTIRARPLHAAGPRWSTEVAGVEATLLAAGDVLVVPSDPVVVLDAATGALRWRAPDAALVRVVGDRVAIAEDGRLAVADLATGRRLWSRPAGPAYGLDAGGDTLVAFDYATARASTYDLATGELLVDGASLGVGADLFGSAYPLPFAEARVVGERLYVYGTGQMRAFRLADLRPLGVAQLSLAIFAVQPCGGQICAIGLGGVSVYPPDLAARRWSARGWIGVTEDGIAVAADGRTARVDVTTGDVVAELGRGAPVGELMLHGQADRTWVTRLDSGRVLGSIPPVVPQRCVAAGAYLACPTTGSTVTAWRLPD